jgi:hypothetical protein
MMKTETEVWLPQAIECYKLKEQETILTESLLRNPADFIFLP